MDYLLLIQMLSAALLATIVYTVIGVAPGTDETATIAPVILVLVMSEIQPIVVLTFFVAAIVASKLTDSILVAIAGIPGGVMAAPMVDHAVVLKRLGLTSVSIQKMASGSVIGTLVSIPVSFLLANTLIPVAQTIKGYGNLLFFVGTIILSLMSKNKMLSLVSIIPFAILIQSLRHLYWGTGIIPKDSDVFISFFLGITIGPVILTLISLLNRKTRNQLERFNKREIILYRQGMSQRFPNPFKILTKKEIGYSAISSFIGSITFIMSPVGITTFLGELLSSRIKNPKQKATLAIACMDALTNATYLAGTLIPLIALGIPLSPVALGPADPLFNAPPVFTLDHNIHHILTMQDFVMATLIGAICALLITYFVTIKFSQQICAFVFRNIPHEAMLGLFFSLVLLLAFIDAGFLNIGGVILISLVSGMLHRLGVNYGVQFMTLYSAPWIIEKIAMF